MTPQEYTQWLEGFFVGLGESKPTQEQIALIKSNLESVFTKKTGFSFSPYASWFPNSTGTQWFSGIYADSKPLFGGVVPEAILLTC